MNPGYLTFSEALAVVDQCSKAGSAIIGIERFSVKHGKIYPDLDGIADFSSLKTNENQISIKLARTYFENYGADQHERFELVID